jgi:ketosteroid isomerase-like protein
MKLMHHWLGSLLALIALSFTAGALASPEEDIDRVEDARYDAMIRVDSAALAATLADEFLYHQPNGKTATKASYIEQNASGAVKIYKAERYDVKIHVYGDIATAMGSTRLDIQFGNERRDVDLRYLNVWVLRDGRWQLAARQSAFKTK